MGVKAYQHRWLDLPDPFRHHIIRPFTGNEPVRRASCRIQEPHAGAGVATRAVVNTQDFTSLVAV